MRTRYYYALVTGPMQRAMSLLDGSLSNRLQLIETRRQTYFLRYRASAQVSFEDLVSECHTQSLTLQTFRTENGETSYPVHYLAPHGAKWEP